MAGSETRVLRWFRMAERLPGGRRLFSQVFRFVAPYFRTIPATIEEVRPGRAVATMRHLPWSATTSAPSTPSRCATSRS